MNNKSETVADALRKSVHPLAQKFQELHKEAFSTPNTDTACEYFIEWMRNNPDQAKELREFLREFEDEFKESRREVSSELGYSRIGLGNV